jgi:hypothetical protein
MSRTAGTGPRMHPNVSQPLPGEWRPQGMSATASRRMTILDRLVLLAFAAADLSILLLAEPPPLPARQFLPAVVREVVRLPLIIFHRQRL